MSSRTGRNYRFAAAGIIATAGCYRQLFRKECDLLAAAALCVLALLALSFIKPDEIDYCRARNATPGEGAKLETVRTLVRNHTHLYLLLCLVLFQFADASVLLLVSENIGTSKAESSSLQITGRRGRNNRHYNGSHGWDGSLQYSRRGRDDADGHSIRDKRCSERLHLWCSGSYACFL
jgi:hypothetical protein